MKDFVEVKKMPTCTDELETTNNRIHESCLRAYWILENVKELLNRNIPYDMTLEFIKMMED